MDQHHGWNISIKPLIYGFLASVGLTLIAYLIAIQHTLCKCHLILVVLGLAILQALVQFVLFMHLGIESKPRWNLVFFVFTVVIMAVIILGSIWIMYNLNYNMMPTMGNS